MPLKTIKHRFGSSWPWVENGFWVLVFIGVYIAMMKVMHPGWNVAGY